ncbi:CapA family protein [Schaalia cardiffensis]|uniref:CapA family protein n=1 Tax=Schaalia cardiffensis TaxID=181487 RepID=UPI0023F31FD1|nr:CapA family protein [Schaalia cardiffensis]
MSQITPRPRLRLPRGSGLAFICALILSCVLMVIYALPLAPGGPIDALSQSDQSAASPQSSDSQTQDKPQPFKPRTLSVVMSGDLLWHSGLWDSAAQVAYETGRGPYDFSVLFGPIRSTIESADLAICHEEVPLAPEGVEPSGYPVFAAPQEVAAAIAETGWDLCTTSSNHSLDQGFGGIETPLRKFDEVGILHTGTFRSPEERSTPTIYTSQEGVRIGVVSGTYSTNGIPLPEGQEWSVAFLDVEDMISRAQAAREAGADIVLAAVHGGEEYVAEPNAQQLEVAEALTASDAIDLVYGHHVHVVQPWSIVNGKWVVYGLGNMVATPPFEYRRSHEGVTARFVFTQSPEGGFVVTRAQYIPTLIDSYWAGERPVLRPVLAALASGEGVTSDLEIARIVTHDTVFSLGVPEVPALGPEGDAPSFDAQGEPIPAAGLEEG